VLTTDYLAITDPDALIRLLDLGHGPTLDEPHGLQLRAFEDPLTSFHPKAYLFWSSVTGLGRGFVGSNIPSIVATIRLGATDVAKT
jgi:HKD family nuclease